MNAYFTGADNVAASLRVPRENVFTTFLYELYSGIPFHNTLFGWEGEKFQTIFNDVNRSYGQIPPTIGSGYYFLGEIFAPFFSAMLAFVSIKFSIAANKTKFYFKYMVYTFASIVTALGIAMYDWTIVYSWFTSWILPLIILAYFSEDTFQTLQDQTKEDLM